MWSKRRPFLLAVAAPFALAGCGPASEAPAERPPLEGAQIGGAFTLTSETGEEARWSDYDGKYRIIYFGFTYCPDVCPLDVQSMMRGFAEFEEQAPDKAAQVQPLFVSVDPGRDTPEVVAEFTDAFHPRLVGLTGTQEQVDAAAKVFAVFHQKGEATAEGGYLVDHSRQAYLMGRKGEPLALLPVDEGPDAVAAELARWVS